MGLSNTKEDQLRQMPIIRSTVSKSRDGKFVVQKTSITHIKPVAYYEAVLKEEGKEELEQTA